MHSYPLQVYQEGSPNVIPLLPRPVAPSQSRLLRSLPPTPSTPSTPFDRLRDPLNFLLRDPLRVFPHCWYDRPLPVRRMADGPLLTQEGKQLTNKSAPSALRSTLYALRFKLYTRSLYSLQKIHSANRYFLKPRTVALFPFFSIFVCNSNN